MNIKRVILWTAFRLSVTGFRSRLGDNRKEASILQKVRYDYFLTSRVTTIS
jgi:hypothetical protein